MTYSILSRTLPVLAGLCLTGLILFGQNTEVRLNAYSGLFSFYGNGSTSVTTGYPNLYGLYGRRPGFSYSFELLAQRVSRQKHLFGLGISVEELRSRAKTTLFETDIINGQTPLPPEKGQTTLTNSFLTLNPFLGQRFFNKLITMDVLAGIDFAYTLKSHVGIKMSTYDRSDDTYSFKRNEITPPVDVRPRVQIGINYKQFSLLIGYSRGMTGYAVRLPGYEPASEAHSNFLRTGLSYKIK